MRAEANCDGSKDLIHIIDQEVTKLECESTKVSLKNRLISIIEATLDELEDIINKFLYIFSDHDFDKNNIWDLVHMVNGLELQFSSQVGLFENRYMNDEDVDHVSNLARRFSFASGTARTFFEF